jgi:pimeloyl-[acyl-carrier protein] methyl ester esterase
MDSDSADHREGGARCSLVLLPGLDGSGVLFRPLIHHLLPELQRIVVVFPPDQLFGYEELIPLVLAALPLNEPFVLLGESFSGPLALMAAATRPPNLKGVILCASFVRNPIWLRPMWLRYLARPIVFRFFPIFSRVKAFLRSSATSTQLQALSAEALSEVTPGVLSHRVQAVL